MDINFDAFNTPQNEELPPYLEGLNGEQRKAVLHTEGPVMIVAGAGSGKTRVLTFRIAYLIHKGVDPFSILSLTFTNKAAREMRNRIEKLVGTNARNIWMGTFHSIFARILRMEADALGYPKNFTIYDSDDSKSLLKSIVKEFNLDDKVYKPGLLLSRISMAKNNLIEPIHYAQSSDLLLQDKNSNRTKFIDIYKEYTRRCLAGGAMDFDDILLNTYKLFRDHINICNKWQQKFKYVMVDEYQDTNHVQYMITKRLAAVHQNICVVGDDAQSIYAFRGANIQNILNYSRDYPDVSTYKLEQNYRSTKNIVLAAGEIIKNNKKQLDKNVWTDNEDGDKIKIHRCLSETEEAKMVAQTIFEEKNNQHLLNSAFAILYRTNSQSRTFEESLRRLNIDYKIFGGMSFYQRKEIKDLLSYLRLTVNPNDEEALKRIINFPARGIGDTTINRLVFIANSNAIPLWDVVCNATQHPEIGSGAAKVANFAMMIQGFQGMLATHNAFEVADHVAKYSTLKKVLYEDKTVEGISRFENFNELLNGIKEFTEDDESDNEKTLAAFLENAALFTDDDKKNSPDRDAVSLMTIHASKGLEFPHVFIVGMEENLFPSQMALHSRAELEEERRLFYVALTRAEKKLTLSFATSRFKYGNLLPGEPSRFLDEVPREFIEMNAASHKQVNPQQEAFAFQAKGNINKSGGEGFSVTKSGTLLKSLNTNSTSNMPPIDPNFEGENLINLEVGEKIQHQRFGYGIVKMVDGDANNRKAVITFDQVGDKTLVLKFAKMKRINS